MNEFDLDFKAFLRRHRDLSWRTTAVLCCVGRPTRNGHIYPQEVMEREIARLSYQPGGVMGYLYKGCPVLDHAAFLVERLHIVHDSVQGTLQFMDTSDGRALKAHMLVGGQVSFGAEGTGRTDGNGVVQDDFHLVAFVASSHALLL